MVKNSNKLQMIAQYQRLSDQYFEEGNQRKCRIAIHRNNLRKIYPISERTMRRWLNTDVTEELLKMDEMLR